MRKDLEYLKYLYKTVSELIFEARHNSERQDKYGRKIMVGTSLIEGAYAESKR